MPAHRGTSRSQRASSAAGTSPTSSTAATSAPRARARSRDVVARRLEPGALERDEVHRHLRPPRDASRNPSARTPGSPPSRSRTARAIAPREPRGRRTSSSQFTATSTGRAPTATAPSAGAGRRARGRVRGRANASRRSVGQRPLARVGVAVEEHRDPELSADPRRELVRRVDRDRPASVPSSATNGTTSTTPKRGCTPSCPRGRACSATAAPASPRGVSGVAARRARRA